MTHQDGQGQRKGTVHTLCYEHSTSCKRESPPPKGSQRGNTPAVPQHIPLTSFFMSLMSSCHGKSQPSLLSKCGPQTMCRLFSRYLSAHSHSGILGGKKQCCIVGSFQNVVPGHSKYWSKKQQQQQKNPQLSLRLYSSSISDGLALIVHWLHGMSLTLTAIR